MKLFLSFLVLAVSFTSFCQKELVYFPAGSDVLENEINLFIDTKNPESLVNILKKEIKRSEVLGGDGQISFAFNSFYGEEGYFPAAVLPDNFFKDVYGDTSEMSFKGYYCNKGKVDGVEIMNCENYYSLDRIDGIVFLEGISQEKLKSLNENMEDIDGYQNFYGQDRIGFVRNIEFKDKLDTNEVKVQKCITFSIPLNSVVEITKDKNWLKLYKTMKNKAIKDIVYETNAKINTKSIFYLDYKNIQEISNLFYHISSEMKDLQFGLVVFNY
jgi:hypothetical protein